ncbi:MAG: aminotransferase [Legionellales bacterium]|nr:aminotransferase [Legionellales bacterium]|tara:strand:+ start:3886 stop:4995 length:1110 start_codon:yes stop_codon:yes gene_type:complete
MIKLSKSCISQAEKNYVADVLGREFLGMGNEVNIFEEKLTFFFERPTLCVINGTAALHLALQSCDIGINDEVLVPSITYLASFQAISATGAKPIPCDINKDNLLINLNDAQKKLTSKTKAIMPVHYAGDVGDLNSIYKFANQNSIRVIEDAAHAFGTLYDEKKVGSFGDIACFSFDGIKNITSGEGGCVVTNDNNVIKKIKDSRLLGVEKDTEKRFSGERSWDFDVSKQGWRYHMSNIMAAIGIVQLERFNELSEKRRKLAIRYDELLKDSSKVNTIDRNYELIVPHIYAVKLTKSVDRKIIQKKMLSKGIEVGYHYQPNHWLSYYKSKTMPPLKVTESVFPKLLTLPLHPDLSYSDIKFVVNELKKII